MFRDAIITILSKLGTNNPVVKLTTHYAIYMRIIETSRKLSQPKGGRSEDAGAIRSVGDYFRSNGFPLT